MNKHPDKYTYWKKGEIDYMGQPTWQGPTVSNCRWEDEQRLYLTDNGREARGRSVLYTPDSPIDIGDYVYEGVSTASTPPVGSFEVKQPRKIKNLRGTRWEQRYIV